MARTPSTIIVAFEKKDERMPFIAKGIWRVFAVEPLVSFFHPSLYSPPLNRSWHNVDDASQASRIACQPASRAGDASPDARAGDGGPVRRAPVRALRERPAGRVVEPGVPLRCCCR